VLVPAAVLIVLGLGAMAMDSATLFLGQRRLSDLAAAVANDAVAGIHEGDFYDPNQDLRLDQSRGEARRDVLVISQPNDRAFESVSCSVTTSGNAATAQCTATVRPIFAPVWPGMEATTVVTATETAVGREG